MKDLKRFTTLLTIALALVGLMALGCSEGAEMPDAEEVAEGDAYETTEVGATIAVDDVATGTRLGDDGAIETGYNDDDFAPGDTVFVAMEVGDATAGSTIEVVLYGPDGMEGISASQLVEADQHNMSFAFETDGWEVGTYRGEVWYNDEMMDEFEINLGT